ncbi:hypothetical protein [Hippea sp. KM1]|uniref:hypothetical protein n=1 Tax=Hippea sp. KM1 TaxID=944481 RepID=UPI00046D28BC|nr:hypothetical protein [Hippea sp. KM1]
MLRLAWFRVFVFISALFIIGVVAFEYRRNTNRPAPKVDSCLNCHSDIKDVGRSHPISVFGCAKCHGGNKYATTKDEAHRGMVLNPASLKNAKKYCLDCHADIIDRVSHSIMETNRGIIGVLNRKYEGIESYPSISQIKSSDNRTFEIDYFRKMCAACHIDQKQSIFPKNRIRGGGCIDCHGVKNKNTPHTILTVKIPSRNCLKCHNRSNRIGLAYFGQFQSAGYGTPYKNGGFSHQIIGGGRYYLKLKGDVHYRKAGLDCIDCHTEAGIMGDGYDHKRFKQQVVIQCEDCHKPQFGKPNDLAFKLADTNGSVPLSKDIQIAYTRKDFRPIYNLQKTKDGRVFFYRKRDGKRFELTLMSNKPYHTLKIHKKLSCQACHSQWMPACYGCHVAAFKNKRQFDWLSHKPEMGAYREFSSFNRFAHPTLGWNENGKVALFAPGCQSFVTVYGGGIKPIRRFHRLFYASWDPHTTQLKARGCADCHFNATTLGLGRGNMDIKGKSIVFKPFFDSKSSSLPIDHPLDSFVDSKGKQLQGVSFKKQHAFSGSDLKRIVSAYGCILCHRHYSDKIYLNFDVSKRLFMEGRTPCSR